MREEFEKWFESMHRTLREENEPAALRGYEAAWQHQQKEIDRLTAEVKRLTERCEIAEFSNTAWAVEGYDYGTPVPLSEFEPKPKQTYLVTWLPFGETIAVQDSGTVQAWKEDATDSGDIANAVTYVYPNPVPMPVENTK